MSPQQRTGLLALAIVGGAFLAAGLVVAVAAMGSRETTPGSGAVEKRSGNGNETVTPKKDLSGPASSGAKDDDAAYIRGHRWWKVKPTKERLEEIVKEVMSKNHGEKVHLTNTGIVGAFKVDPTGSEIIEVPPGFGRLRRVSFTCNWQARPTREQVLKRLRDAIEEDEYERGPGG